MTVMNDTSAPIADGGGFDKLRPLNGTRTHPLKAGSLNTLRELRLRDIPSHLINPGVRNRLTREALAEEYVEHGRRFYRITDAGREASS